MAVTIGLAAALAAGQPTPSLKGSVIAAVGATPIANATIVAQRNRTATTSDVLGRWRLDLAALPDTLVITAIGWKPDTMVVAILPTDPIAIALDRAPTILSDLIATAPASAIPEVAALGRWRLPMAAARTIPPAVETDIYRALALIPAINFSSPLSARPLLRGYDAQDVATRIDGFEIVNLYHLGRVFSSFPADAAETITVSAAPYPSGHGGAVAGLIDIDGRIGRRGDFEVGGGLSYGALSAHAGGGSDRIRYFGAARLFYWKSLELIPKVDVPYQFEDLYGGAVFGPPERPRGRVTLFATEDRAGHTIERNYLHWSNVLVGGRWRLFERGPTTLEISVEAVRSLQKGEDVPGVHTIGTADLANRFSRLRSTAEFVRATGATRMSIGLTGGYRAIANQIHDHARAIDLPVVSFPLANLRSRTAELGGWGSISRRTGRVAAEVAVRADVSESARAIEPRAHLRWFAGPGIEIALGVGRTGRLYQLLSEARSEPDFDFLDFWLDPSDSVPAARADHGTLDFSLGTGPWVGRISFYASKGRGIGELRPETDQRPGPNRFFRFGRARTRGLEAQIGYRGNTAHPYSLSASYVLAQSDRAWGQGWVRWALDRRHQARAFGQWRIGRVNWFAALDAASGTPITPVDYQMERAGVPGVPSGPVVGRPNAASIYGKENSATTSGTFRVDAGIAYAFRQAGHRYTLGVSVVNLLATAVAPFGPVDGPGTGPIATTPTGQPAPYRRLFKLPPIPTLTLRAEF